MSSSTFAVHSWLFENEQRFQRWEWAVVSPVTKRWKHTRVHFISFLLLHLFLLNMQARQQFWHRVYIQMPKASNLISYQIKFIGKTFIKKQSVTFHQSHHNILFWDYACVLPYQQLAILIKERNGIYFVYIFHTLCLCTCYFVQQFYITIWFSCV